MGSRGIIGALAAILFLLPAAPAAADATLLVDGSDGLRSIIQLRAGKGRMAAAGVDEYVVFDSRAGTVTYVEPAQGQYTQVSAAELESGLQTAAGIRQAVAPYMGDMLAGLPPAQRRMIEQRIGPLPGAPAAGGEPAARIETVARGQHTIAGLSCRASGIVKNGRPSAEVCMATGPSGKLSAEDFRTLEALVAFSRGMAASAAGMFGDLAQQIEFLASDIDGVPVAVRDLENGRRYQVTAVSDAVLSDELFTAHGRLSRREMPALLR